MWPNQNPPKIDDAATLGLAGVDNSLAYRIAEVERHLHNREKWFGVAAAPAGETHAADRMDGVVAPFALLSGASAFGNWVQILGSTDTPVIAGSANFDGHRFMVTGTDSTLPFVVQIITGESADFAAKLAAEEFTEAPYIAASNNNDSGISDIMTRRVPVGTKVWARCACVGASAKTISLYFGIHEYEGV